MSIKVANLSYLTFLYRQMGLSQTPKEEVESSNSCLVPEQTSAYETALHIQQLLQSHFKNTKGDFRKASVFFVNQCRSCSDPVQRKYITNLVDSISKEDDVVLQVYCGREEFQKRLSIYGLSWPTIDLLEDSIDTSALTKNLIVRGCLDSSLEPPLDYALLDRLHLKDSLLWEKGIKLSQEIASILGIKLKDLSKLPRRECRSEIEEVLEQSIAYEEQYKKNNPIGSYFSALAWNLYLRNNLLT